MTGLWLLCVEIGMPKSNRKPTNVGKVVAIFFKEFSLIPSNMLLESNGPINTFNGRMGSSTIDFIAIRESLKNLLVSSEVLCDEILNLSDHNAVRAVPFKSVGGGGGEERKIFF